MSIIRPYLSWHCRLASCVQARFFSSKVPSKPTWDPIDTSKLPPETHISDDMIEHLERLSLVDFSNEEGIQRLEAAIRFADQLHLVNTEGVNPMYTVQEHSSLYLRRDEVTEGNCREDILKNAKKTYDEYFVVPPGNIPMKKEVQYNRKDET